jgi:CHAD domain-containing protein
VIRKARRKRASARLAKGTLRLPAAEGIRLVALEFLQDAESARKNLARSPDAKALHDLRVALRRLRSWLRSFKPEFDGVTRKRDRRALREITAATNLGRDIDVQLVWLRDAAKGKRRRGADWMKKYLTTRQQLAGNPVDSALLKRFSRVRKDLKERLTTAPSVKDTDSRTLASAIAARLTTHVEALDEALGDVHSVADEKQAHKARIVAKRLRYLLEPAAVQVKQGAEVVRMLKSLQDELGELHDAHVLAHELKAAMESSASENGGDGDAPAPHDTEVPQGALATLHLRLGRDAQVAFDRVHADWLSERYVSFKQELASFAQQLDEAYGAPR